VDRAVNNSDARCRNTAGVGLPARSGRIDASGRPDIGGPGRESVEVERQFRDQDADERSVWRLEIGRADRSGKQADRVVLTMPEKACLAHRLGPAEIRE
jgi:hypothetical protein